MILGGILFVLGLVVGSAINSFLWRYQTKTTYKGRSMCPVCKHQLSWADNIPLLSWLLLSGKCRYCKKSISVQYPVVELLTGASFVIVGMFSEAGAYVNHVAGAMFNLNSIFSLNYFMKGVFELTLLLLVSGLLTLVSVHDYKTKEIPNGFNLAFLIISLAYLVLINLRHPVSGLWSLVASACAFLFFYSFVFFSKETWMGGGDAKMAIGMGLLLGPAGTFLAILVASVTGSIYGLTSLAMSKKRPGNLRIDNSKLNKNFKLKTKNFSHEVPFGPFLALGTYISMVFGANIIDWYVKIVLGL